MTYCVGMLLDAGLVCLSDSRTNAGVDHINTFRKMNLFERPGERVLALMSAGNLALTQTLVSLLRERLATDGPNLYTVTNMFEAARHVGDCLREVHARDAEALKEFGIEFNASLILGGQILGEEPRLFQIGEAKYGKPIIDRVIRPETTLDEAAKCALISMDSTIRSNLSVGLPLDLLVLRTGALKVCSHTRIDAENAYFEMIRTRWGESLREAFHALPSPDWIPPA